MPVLPPSRPNASLAGKFFQGGVNVHSYYSSEPAPMGIADYGIGPNGPFIRTTTQFMGEVTIYQLKANSSFATPCVSFQLNVVLNYQYGGNTYALWIQDVAFYDTYNYTVWFLDNVWNLTSVNANVTGVVGNGGIYTFRGTEFYAYQPGLLPGNYVPLSLPASIYLLVNVSVNSLGQPVIYFWYNDGYGWINYDTVTVTNIQFASNVYFMVNGYQYTGAGYFYDAELVMGGPGGGSTAYLYSSQVFFSLSYWNGHNFQGIENAYNFGSDTGETVSNAVDTTYYYPFSGELVAGVTAGSGTLGSLWTSDQVSTLTVETGMQSGYVVVYNDTYQYSPNYEGQGIPFTGGLANLTVYPMNYAVLVYSAQGQLIGEANVALYGGEVTSTPVTQFSLSVPGAVTETTLTFSIPVTVYAYGTVTLSVIAPSGVTYTLPGQVTVDGEATEYLDVTVPRPGTYDLTVVATLFPGFYVENSVEVLVTQPTVQVAFVYEVIGQPLPTSPTVTLQFPNGTTESFPMPISLAVPVGTTYSVQQIVGTSQGIRWATPTAVEGFVNESGSIDVVYYEQYLVTFEFEVQGGQGYGNPSVVYTYFGTEVGTSAPATVWVDCNSTYTYSQILPGSNSQARWVAYNYEGVVSSPGTISVFYNYEFNVTVLSLIPVYALVNGTNTTLKTGWYIIGTTINVENLTYYVNSQERYVIASVYPSEKVTVASPLILEVYAIRQYYVTVNSPIPVYALVNGTNVTLVTGWYNAGDVVKVENVTYYPYAGARDVIVSISPQSFTVTSPEEVTVSVMPQYYVNLITEVPIHALVNGTNTTFKAGWYNKGTTIVVENLTYYPSQGSRYVIVSVMPSERLTLEGPVNLVVISIKQYYVTVTVNSPIPVYALVNGTNTTLTTGWYNAGTEIQVENLTYYVNPQERYVPTSISPSTLKVNSPSSVDVTAVKQFLVTVNGVSSWYNQGSTVTLNANVPIYEVGKFVGTDNVSPGATLVVNGPIHEQLVESPNYAFIGSVGVVVAAVAGAAVALSRKKPGK
ncbi:MAG: thermopsin [Candidatus Aramenus sulfurataquae]|uniref:Thermopsin n=1 Tax=Candidatus Aramenus sulfurataquae TaxID=1326980 RepID=W7L4R3_9CREN|nr:MAG: thermopsin [Candidatus Aramenus sulfurataquae]